MRPRHGLLALAALALVTGGAAAGSSARSQQRPSPGATFVLTGRGWGHGVGLSQCGAVGYAKHGWKYVSILRHYYPGTAVTRTPDARVRVLLADGRRSVTITSRSVFTVKDGAGKSYRLRAGSYELGTGLKVKIDPAKPAQGLPAPLTFVPGNVPLALDKPYRGQLLVKSSSGLLRVVNSVPVEQYLYGVVPLEIGATGPAEALKTQAVAARSYALAARGSGDFDLYPDTRSQVYGGVSAEKEATNAAVNATAGRVLTYKDKVVSAYYSASSGGRTAAVQDAWPGSRPVAYLVSVDDPYDDVCPEHAWGPTVFSGPQLARKLGISARVTDVRTVVNPSMRVNSLTVRTTSGRASLSGTNVRRILGLRSTWFRFGVLSLARPAGTAVYGVQFELTGVARGLTKVVLQQRIPGKPWTRAARVKSRADGTFTAKVRSKQTAEYRLAAGKVAGGAVRVDVSPRLRLEAGIDELSGSVRPAFVDARVQIQRLTGSGWSTVARTTTDAAGDFYVALSLSPGSYRGRIGSRRGFVAGTSPTVRVDL
jgi:stage II sporulation protein D